MLVKVIFARKTRALLTILGVAVGISTFVSIRGFADGFAREWGEIYSAADVDVILLGSAFVSRSINEHVVAQAAELPVADSAFGVLASIEGYEDRNLMCMGIPPDIAGGGRRFIRGGIFDPTKREVALGELAVEVTGKDVGDEIELLFEKYLVAGVFEAESIYESGAIIFPIRELQRLIDEPGRVTGVHIRLTDEARATPESRDAAVEVIRKTFPTLLTTSAERVADNYQALRMLDALTWGVSLIALFLGVIGVTNTLTMSVLENTREIGILRAIGWQWKRVFTLVIVESVFFSFVGGALGCASAEVITRLIEKAPMMHGFVDAGLNTSLHVQGMAVALIMGVVCCAYPCWRVWLIDPIKALKYQ